MKIYQTSKTGESGRPYQVKHDGVENLAMNRVLLTSCLLGGMVMVAGCGLQSTKQGRPDGAAEDGVASGAAESAGEQPVNGEAEPPLVPAPSPTADREPPPSAVARPFGLLFDYEYPQHTFSATPLVAGKRLLVVDYEGRVTCLPFSASPQTATPAAEWEFQGHSLGYEAPAVATDEDVYVAAYEGIVDCLDIATGESRWKYVANGTISAPPLVHDDRLLIGTEAGQLICLKRESGEEEWTFQAADQIHAVPRVVGDKILVVAACSRTMHVVNLENGTEDKQIELPGETAAPFVVREDKVYVTTMYGDAVCYDWKNGRKVWSHSFNPEVQPRMEGGPVIIGNAMYVGGTDSFLRAFDIENQQPIWSQRIKGAIESELAVDGHLIASVTPRGRVYLVDRSNGKIRWQYESNGDILASPIIVDETLIFANDAGRVYGFGPLSKLP